MKETPNTCYKYRWVLEIFTAITFSGIYFGYSSVVGIHNSLQEMFKDDKKVSENFEFYYNTIYSAFAIPNIIFPFITGRLSDIFGNRGLIFAICIAGVIGQGLIYLGGEILSVVTMIIGRAVSGIAIGSILPLCSKLISHYFQGELMAMVISLNLGLGTFFDAMDVSVSPTIAHKSSVNMVLLVCFMAAIISFLCSIVVIFLDKHAESHKNRLMSPLMSADDLDENNQLQQQQHAEQHQLDLETAAVDGEKEVNKIFHLTKAQKKLKKKKLRQKLMLSASQNIIFSSGETTWTKVKELTLSYWCCCLGLAFIFWASVTFTSNVVPIISDAHYKGVNPIEVEKKIQKLALVLLAIETPMLPLMGFVVDKFSLNLRLVIGFAGALIMAVSLVTVYLVNPYITVTLFAISLSFYMSSMWSYVPLLVNKSQLGIAYGIIICLKFTGILCNSIFVGHYTDKNKGGGGSNSKDRYKLVLLIQGFYCCLAMFCLVIILVLKVCKKNKLSLLRKKKLDLYNSSQIKRSQQINSYKDKMSINTDNDQHDVYFKNVYSQKSQGNSIEYVPPCNESGLSHSEKEDKYSVFNDQLKQVNVKSNSQKDINVNNDML